VVAVWAATKLAVATVGGGSVRRRRMGVPRAAFRGGLVTSTR
jgi:hypothetical protein